MARRGYSPEFRRKVVDLVESGRRGVDVARDLGISEQSITPGGVRIASIRALCRA